MELRLLDSLFQTERIIEEYESLIWTDRWQTLGDFEMVIESTLQNRIDFTAGRRLDCSFSSHIMVIETVDDGEDEEGNRTLVIKGSSLESILDHRILMGSATGANWKYKLTPGAAALKMFKDICIDGIVSSQDILRDTVTTTFGDPGNLTLSPYELELDLPPQPLRPAIENLAKQWDFGYRLVRDKATGLIHFNVYGGSNRTSYAVKTTGNAVLFSKNLDNLQNIRRVSTDKDTKNAAYIAGPGNRFIMLLPYGTAPDIDSYDRKVLYVDARDIDTTTITNIENAMVERGYTAFLDHMATNAFDGEIDQSSSYVYGRDYDLGDIVEMQDEGMSYFIRVSEHIYVSDQNGDRSYPTLDLNTMNQLRTWGTAYPTQVWMEMGAETWEDV